MSRLLRLYPRWWRQRYGEGFAAVLDDVGQQHGWSRIRITADILRGAWDAHLNLEGSMSKSDLLAARRGLVLALIAWAAISVDVVLSNVVYPSTGDNDGASVLVAYLGVFVVLVLAGYLAQRRAATVRGPVLAGALAGALIGALTIGTYLIVDNLFLATIAQQQPKIHGLANSGMTSMRAYVNLSLLYGLGLLSVGLAVIGGGLGALGAVIGRAARRTG